MMFCVKILYSYPEKTAANAIPHKTPQLSELQTTLQHSQVHRKTTHAHPLLVLFLCKHANAKTRTGTPPLAFNHASLWFFD